MIVSARGHAGRLGQSQVGTEHLLLGCLSDTSYVSALALGSILGDTNNFKRALEAVQRRGLGAGSNATSLSEEARLALEAGVRFAKEMEAPIVTTGHLLLGVLEDSGASWVPLAAALGVTVEAIQPEVAQFSLVEDGGIDSNGAGHAPDNGAGNGASNGALSSQNGSSPRLVHDNAELFDLVAALRREVASLRNRVDHLETEPR